MLFSEARNHPVLSTDTATTVGTVAGFVVDPTTSQVVAVRLKKTEGSGDTLHWPDLAAFGTDTVTVASADTIVAARDRAAVLAARDAELVGKRLLSDAGAEIGTVTDIDFDPTTGSVLSLITANGPIQGDRLIGCGSYAVIVRSI